MQRKQIIVCLTDGRWVTDFLHHDEGQDIHEAVAKYQECYEAVRECNLPIIARLLPAIMQVFVVGE